MRDDNGQWQQQIDQQSFEKEYGNLFNFDKEFSEFVKSHEEENVRNIPETKTPF